MRPAVGPRWDSIETKGNRRKRGVFETSLPRQAGALVPQLLSTLEVL